MRQHVYSAACLNLGFGRPQSTEGTVGPLASALAASSQPRAGHHWSKPIAICFCCIQPHVQHVDKALHTFKSNWNVLSSWADGFPIVHVGPDLQQWQVMCQPVMHGLIQLWPLRSSMNCILPTTSLTYIMSNIVYNIIQDNVPTKISAIILKMQERVAKRWRAVWCRKHGIPILLNCSHPASRYLVHVQDLSCWGVLWYWLRTSFCTTKTQERHADWKMDWWGCQEQVFLEEQGSTAQKNLSRTKSRARGGEKHQFRTRALNNTAIFQVSCYWHPTCHDFPCPGPGAKLAWISSTLILKRVPSVAYDLLEWWVEALAANSRYFQDI